MFENAGELTQLFTKGWPVMLAAPGIALALLAGGFAFAWWLRGHIMRGKHEGLTARIEALAEKVDVADRHRALFVAQLADLGPKYDHLKVQYERAIESIRNLTRQVENTGKSLDGATGFVKANVADLGRAASELGYTIATIQATLGSGPMLTPIDPSPPSKGRSSALHLNPEPSAPREKN